MAQNWWDSEPVVTAALGPLPDAAKPQAANWWDSAPLVEAGPAGQDPNAPGALKSAGLGAVQGFSLNLSDEIGGAIGAGIDYLTGDAKDGIGAAYDANRDAIRKSISEAKAANPGAFAVGEIAGGIGTLAVPGLGTAGAIARGASVGKAATRLAGVGGGIGAVSGFGAGEGLGDRLQQAAIGGVAGAALGGAAGGIGQKLVNRATASAAPRLGGPSGREVLEAGENLTRNVSQVDIPIAAASDSMVVQQAGKLASNAPFVGDSLIDASQKTVSQLDDAVRTLAQRSGGASNEAAGEVAGTGVRNWITGKSRAVVNKAYDAVDTAIDNNVLNPLSRTQEVAGRIRAQSAAAALNPETEAVKIVSEAVNRPGLTYQGLKQLRTRVGEMLNNPQNPLPAGMSQAELKQIYGALTDDLGNAARNAGGERGAQLWQRANQLNAAVSARRERLASLLGAQGDSSPAQIFERLKAAATAKGRADTRLLTEARRVMGGDWEEVVSGVVGQLGRNNKGEFSPTIFLSDYQGKFSDEGRRLLFDGVGNLRASLDSIATISDRMRNLEKFANPSGTGRQVIGAAGISSAVYNPLGTLAAAVGGRLVSRALASPASASSLAKWARAYEVAVRRPSAASVAVLARASKGLAATMGDDLGASVSPDDLMKI